MRARVWLPVVALLGASAFCVALVLARRHLYGPGGFRYLVWNLGLAWAPLLFALLLYAAYRRRHTGAELLALGAAWLVFLPNAPYMVTDFVHLGDRHRLVDAAILASFAFTALALGAMFLASAGVYLGRVHRFNSWDVVTRPRLVAWTMWQGLDDPFAHVHLLLFVAAGGCFLALAYVGLYGVAGLASSLHGEEQPPVLLSGRKWPSRSSSSNRS